MNDEQVQNLIRKLRQNQQKHYDEIESIIKELEDTSITKKATPLTIGDRVNILNPSRGGDSQGSVYKIGRRVTITTTRGKVVRALKNIEKIE